ncbi:hypothetical protein CQA66_02980 [Helicobacter aurati]|uniref:Uncharacterized protein n=1 Tax=Helicobacter aurati TaxID=137778 RepID=A0A3D8J6X2_9HELI|nr:hypothetical protein [Helicobacter aurati]RDU72866.1 hypothetical protein CQA66_02980 [Helicobacter aurati]
MRKILCCISIVCYFVLAKAPIEPSFSLHNHEIQEPPALPQVYGMVLPDTINYFSQSHKKQEFNAFLPEFPMIMQVCAITETPVYYYPNREELLNGCYRGDKGLSFFELQPYQYWQTLKALQEVQLIPQIANHNVIRILINYKYAYSDQITTTIEIGDSNYPATSIVINGQTFHNNYDVVSAFYGLIKGIQEEAYPRDTAMY